MDLQKFVKNVATDPGVYTMYDRREEIIYIGKAKNLRNRLKSYFVANPNNEKVIQLVANIHRISVTITPSELDALLLEISLIKTHQPRYNIQFKDGKGYPYIVFDTSHTYPRLFITRNKKSSAKQMTWLGPYPHKKAAYEIVNHFYKIFKIRDCKDSFFANRDRPCLRHQIGRCHAPCTKKISPQAYQQQVMLAIKMLQGKDTEVVDEVRGKMQQCAKERNYLQAAQYRDLLGFIQNLLQKNIVANSKGSVDIVALVNAYGQSCVHIMQARDGQIQASRSIFPSNTKGFSDADIMNQFLCNYYLSMSVEMLPSEIVLNYPVADQQLLATALHSLQNGKLSITVPKQGQKKELLDMCLASAKEALSHRIDLSDFYKLAFEQLQSLLSLDKLPIKLECFDISHFAGEATLASCVILTLEGPQKNLYRQYKLPQISNGDDYAALSAVIYKRYQKILASNGILPDMLLIDGGVGQLSCVVAVMTKLGLTHIPVIAIAKGKERKAGNERFFLGAQAEVLGIEYNSNLFKALQHIRDEAHKFAINNNRKAIRKRQVSSVLQQIPGVGAAKRKQLLEFFGGMQGVKNASIEQLAKAPGIGPSLASKIFSIIHQ